MAQTRFGEVTRRLTRIHGFTGIKATHVVNNKRYCWYQLEMVYYKF